MAVPFSKQDHVTLPNGKSMSKLLFEALVVFFSTELTDENARSFPTEYQSVQRWRTTRKTTPGVPSGRLCKKNTQSP